MRKFLRSAAPLGAMMVLILILTACEQNQGAVQIVNLNNPTAPSVVPPPTHPPPTGPGSEGPGPFNIDMGSIRCPADSRGEFRVSFSWSSSNGATSYTVERRGGPNTNNNWVTQNPDEFTSFNSNSFVQLRVRADYSYDYRVWAVGNGRRLGNPEEFNACSAVYIPPSAPTPAPTPTPGAPTPPAPTPTPTPTLPPAPTVGISANPSSVTAGQSSALVWSSSNTTSCSASGGWNGSKATAGNEFVVPSSTVTYTIMCSGPGGSATASATVTVGPPTGPTCTSGANFSPFGGTGAQFANMQLTPMAGCTGRFTSSNPNKVSVTSGGFVTFLNSGEAAIQFNGGAPAVFRTQ